MPTIAGTYEISVPAGLAGWTVGPIFRVGQSFRIQAAGAVQWSAVSSVVGPLVSTPPTFATPSPPPSSPATVTFDVPVGTYVSGTWEIKGSGPSGVDPTIRILTDSDAVGSQTSSPFDVTVALTPAQIADVNAAAGGTLTVNVTTGAEPTTYTGFTLSLAGPPLSALPEGAYPPDYSSSAAFDPSAVLTNADWTGSGLVATNIVPLCLAAIALPDGVTPAFASGAYAALRPERDTTFEPADLAAVGASEEDAVYRLWFVFNDGISDFSDNSGSFSLTITTYEITMSTPDPITSLITPQMGVEGPYGVTVPASRVINCFDNSSFDISPEQKKEKRGLTGIGFQTNNDLTTEMSKGSAKGWLDFRDFPYILQSVYGSVSSSTPATGVRQWTAEDNAYANNVPVSYSYELPTAPGERAQGVAGLYFDGIKVSTERDKQFTLTSSIYGKILGDGVTPTVGQNCVQVVTPNGVPTGGTLILLCDNVPTAPFAYNAAASAVQTAIRAVGGAYATVTVTGTGPWTITIPGGVPISLIVPIYMVAGVNTLTGGATPTATASITTPGGMNLRAGNKVLPGILGVSFATDLNTLLNAPTMVASQFTTEIDIAERYFQRWIQSPTQIGHANVQQKKAAEIDDSVTLTMAYNAQAAPSFISNSQGGTVHMYARIAMVGPQIGATAYNFTIFLDVCADVTWEKNTDSQGNIRSVDFKLDFMFDVATGFRSRWTVINDVTSYAS